MVFDSNSSDASPLYERISLRDTHALDELIKQESKRVMVIIHHNIKGTGCQEDVEDLAFSVFKKIWNRINDYDPSRGKFTTWINLLAITEAKDFLRKEKRREQIRTTKLKKEETQTQSHEIDVLERLDEMRRLEIVAGVVDTLSEIQQEIIKLHIIDGKSLRQIAKDLNKPEGTVKSTYYRSIEHIKRLIQAGQQRV